MNNTPQKKIIVVCAVSLLFAASFSMVSAAEGTPAVQKALEDTKAYIDDLVTAKDDSESNSLLLKVETFRQVLDLSSAETKDLEFKLLTVERDARFEAWRRGALERLTQALAYYDSKREALIDRGSLTADKVVNLAKDFKIWRDAEYVPLVNQVQDYILIKQEEKAVQTAEKRFQKVSENLTALGIGSDNKTISKYLAKAKASIAIASDLNKQAEDLFVSLYVTATSTPSADSSSSASSIQEETATSTPSSPPPTSIKDLVKASLDEIKSAYQSFIDISGLVRKLLK